MDNKPSTVPYMADTLAIACGRPVPQANSYKTMTAISQTNFSVLAKIVNALKERFLEGYHEPSTLQEILEEVGLADISRVQREWLAKDALSNNPKIRVIDGEDNVKRYEFKPVLEIKDKLTLVRCLQEQDEAGKGAISMHDAIESYERLDDHTFVI